MEISIIAAIGKDRSIGFEGKIPWYLPFDLYQFQKITTGHHLLMGRKTYESIGRPLPGRTSIVLTRQSIQVPEGVLVAHSIEQAVQMAKNNGESELFVAGGAEVYRLAMPIANWMYLTVVNYTPPQADTFFPEFNPTDWQEVAYKKFDVDEFNEHSFRFSLLKRKL